MSYTERLELYRQIEVLRERPFDFICNKSASERKWSNGSRCNI